LTKKKCCDYKSGTKNFSTYFLSVLSL